MNPLPCFALLIAFSAAPASHGEIYRHTDEHGRTVYSDSPRGGGEAVDLPPVNTSNAVSPTQRPYQAPSQAAQAAPITARISQPQSGQIFANGRLGTTVNIELGRPLRSGESLRILHNGRVISQGKALSARIDQLNRGTHQIRAEVLGPDGQQLSADALSIIAHWPGN